jgi:hypothetical protein
VLFFNIKKEFLYRVNIFSWLQKDGRKLGRFHLLKVKSDLSQKSDEMPPIPSPLFDFAIAQYGS